MKIPSQGFTMPREYSGGSCVPQNLNHPRDEYFMLIYLQRAARFVLALELPLLGLITFAFWYPSPIRDQWLWLLYLLIPIYAARVILYRRLWTWTPLTPWLFGYVILVIINIMLGLYLA